MRQGKRVFFGAVCPYDVKIAAKLVLLIKSAKDFTNFHSFFCFFIENAVILQRI